MVYGKTPAEIRKIFDATDKTEEEVTRDELLKEIFLWWWDSYMEVIATPVYWNEDIRCTKLFTDTHNMQEPRKSIKENQHFKQIWDEHFANKVYITKNIEAFALWALENCHTKWVAEFKYRAIYPHKKANKLPNTPEYEALYTDRKSGKKEFGGWRPAGLQRWNELLMIVNDFRNSDKVVNGEYPKLVKELLRELHCLAEDDELPQKGKRGKKRKKSGPPAVKLLHFKE